MADACQMYIYIITNAIVIFSIINQPIGRYFAALIGAIEIALIVFYNNSTNVAAAGWRYFDLS